MNKSKGFTLIEVLVVVVIVATALVAAVRSSSGFSRQSANLIAKANARMVAQNVSAQLLIDGIDQGTSSKKGEQEMGFSSWFWQAETSPFEADAFEAPEDAEAATNTPFQASAKPALVAVKIRVFANPNDTYHAYSQTLYVAASQKQ